LVDDNRFEIGYGAARKAKTTQKSGSAEAVQVLGGRESDGATLRCRLDDKNKPGRD
jgi:hypothetical protein